MPKAQVIAETTLDQVLHGAAQLDTVALEEVLQQVSRLLARRKAPSVPQREVELLQQSSHYLSPTMQYVAYSFDYATRSWPIIPCLEPPSVSQSVAKSESGRNSVVNTVIVRLKVNASDRPNATRERC